MIEVIGTSVAGLIGALTDNSQGVAGMIWNGRVLVHKTADQYGVCPTACFSYHPSFAMASAIDDAVRRGAQIINISVGYPTSFPSVNDLLDFVWDGFWEGEPLTVATYNAHKLGSLVVASAGNEGQPHIDLPATFPWVLNAGASDINGDRVSTSNYGWRLDLLAPGEGLQTTAMLQDGAYGPFSGTSAAAPVTAGAAGLVLSESWESGLGLTSEDVRRVIELTCRDYTAPPAGDGRDDDTGWGYLDVGRALSRLRPPYQVIRGGDWSGNVTLVRDRHPRKYRGNNPPASEYYAKVYEVRKRISFCGALAETPLVWARAVNSRGWSLENPGSESYAEIDNVTVDGFDLVTYVHYVEFDLFGSRRWEGWYPCQPADAFMAYTASIRSVLRSAEINGARTGCAGTWSTTTCGAPEEATYEWFERGPGGTWSGVVATTPEYSRSLPSADLELRVVVSGGGVSVADTHYVNYVTCTVEVDAAPPRVFRLSTTGNPVAGKARLVVELPVDQFVDLGLFDVSGRRVLTVFGGRLLAGVHHFDWGVGAEPGLYFARLSGVSGVEIRRIALVR